MSSADYDDPKIEAKWITEQRENVLRYLECQEVRHRGVAPRPDWFVAPYVSIWRVESMKKPGTVGWWAVSGDLPTDYLSGHDARDARTALAAFAKQWREASACMLRGEEHPDVRIGCPENRRQLGDLLRRRSKVFQDWANDDTMW
jgi:hypothetical protein